MTAAGLFGAWLWWRGQVAADPLVPGRDGERLVAWLRRGDLRLDRHRDRAPALGRLRNPAQRADALSPVSAASVATTLVLFVVVYARRVRHGHLLHQSADREGTARVAPSSRRNRHARATVVRQSRSRSRNSVGTIARLMRRAGCAVAFLRARFGIPRRPAMEWYLPVIWAALIGIAVAHVRHPRRLRSRHRHSVSVRGSETRARPDDELGRAVLGRQRDLAGARRRRAAGGVSGRLCGDHAGASICR